MSDIVNEHYQIHKIIEIEHIPDHDERKETKEFRNAKHELESVEHIHCYVCGTHDHLESHHIFERCWANAYDLKKVAYMLFHHFDFHQHVKRDFKNESELYNFLKNHKSVEEGLDSIYNQVILCESHHREEGHSTHGSSFASFCALLVDKKNDGFEILLTPEEYEEMKKKLLEEHHKENGK